MVLWASKSFFLYPTMFPWVLLECHSLSMLILKNFIFIQTPKCHHFYLFTMSKLSNIETHVQFSYFAHGISSYVISAKKETPTI